MCVCVCVRQSICQSAHVRHDPLQKNRGAFFATQHFVIGKPLNQLVAARMLLCHTFSQKETRDVNLYIYIYIYLHFFEEGRVSRVRSLPEFFQNRRES